MKRPPDLRAWALPGARFTLRVTPRAGADSLEPGDDAGATIRIRITAPPEDGRANAAVQGLLAKALGVAPSRLRLLRGASARDKLFQLD